MADSITNLRLKNPVYLGIAQRAIDRYGDKVSWDARFVDATIHRPDVEKALALYEEIGAEDSRDLTYVLHMMSYTTRDKRVAAASTREYARVAALTARQLERDPFDYELIQDKIDSLRSPVLEFEAQMPTKLQEVYEKAGVPSPTDRALTAAEEEKAQPFFDELKKERETVLQQVRDSVRPYAENLLHYGQFNGRAWQARLYSSDVIIGDEKEELQSSLERTVAIYSNYKLEHARQYVSNLYSRRALFDRMSKAGETEYGGSVIDPAAERDKMNCELVVAARLAIQSCEARPDQKDCEDRSWWKTPSQILNEAKRDRLCPAMLYVPIGFAQLPPPLTLEDLR